jgi:hypothetical protein
MATSSRRKPKPAAPAIDLDEIEQDPGFRGMLSFLEVSPADKALLLAQRKQVESQLPGGQSPTAQLPMVQLPVDLPPMGDSAAPPPFVLPPPQPPQDDSPTDDPPLGQSPRGSFVEITVDPDLPTGDSPSVEPPMGDRPGGWSPKGRSIPYMDVEGRGKRPLRFCRTVQDGHTTAEHVAYQLLSAYAAKYGRAEEGGSMLLDIGLSQLCMILGSDHKNVKRLIGSLRDKLALEIVRQPDYRRAIPTCYRIFSQAQVLERRRSVGWVWVVRTRTVRFVDLATVNRLLDELPQLD